MKSWTEVVWDHLRGSKTTGELEAVRARAVKRLEGKAGATLSGRAADLAIDTEMNEILTEDHGRATKDLVASALATVYWESLREHLIRRRVTRKTIAEGLSVAPSQLSRWGKETLPHPSKFFVVILKWAIDARIITPHWLPPHATDGSASIFDPRFVNDVVVRGVCLTVEQIRVREFGSKHEILDQQELTCVRHVKQHEEGMVLLGDAARGDVRAKVVQGVINSLAREGNSGLNEATVREIARRWLPAYVLFDEGRPAWNWSVIDAQ